VRLLFEWWRGLSAHALFVVSFLILILLGTLGLVALPGLHVGARLGVVDALFTMTSAVCVTGLIVVDTATVFTHWGQLWILLFIQLGGLGLISLTTVIIGALGRRLSLRSEMIALPTSRHADTRPDVRAVTLATARFTLVVESVGAAVLFLAFLPAHPPGQALWHAVFHSVSAFCNAGFSTFSTSLVDEAARPWVMLPISALVILGGLGYLATAELVRWHKLGGRRTPRRLSSHTFAVLVTTAILLGAGAIFFAVFEWHGVLARFGLGDKLVNAWFMSVTPRTAGFNAVSYAEIGNESALMTMLLMTVGGSPGSMAGGVKTTAVAVLFALAAARVTGRRHVELHGRTVPPETLERTVSLLVIAFLVVTVAGFVLNVSESRGATLLEERAAVLPLLFETVSAFMTVGLSMDTTATLSTAGRVHVVVLMFVGRVGPLAFFAAVAMKRRAVPAAVRDAREDLIVG
jgi:trk system potassium uptake protein